VRTLDGLRLPAPPRAVYADLDGTLFGPGGSLFATPGGPSTRGAEAVGRLHAAGIELVLVSGRIREQMIEAARILGARSFIAELGAILVERGDPDEVVANFGAFEGDGSPFEAMARSGAGALLLERYAGRLELHTPWSSTPREATMLFRGLLDEREATAALAAAGYRWLEVRDNGRVSRAFETLDVPEVRAYHLVPRGVSKAAAVRMHRERRGLGRGAVAAVGDSVSDLEMSPEVAAMVLVGFGGTPSPEGDNVFVTASGSGDGFAEAVDAFLG
jgi:hypothetical protein